MKVNFETHYTKALLHEDILVLQVSAKNIQCVKIGKQHSFVQKKLGEYVSQHRFCWMYKIVLVIKIWVWVEQLWLKMLRTQTNQYAKYNVEEVLESVSFTAYICILLS